MKARKSPEYGYACGLVLKTADFSVHVPLQQHTEMILCAIHSIAQLTLPTHLHVSLRTLSRQSSTIVALPDQSLCAGL